MANWFPPSKIDTVALNFGVPKLSFHSDSMFIDPKSPSPRQLMFPSGNANQSSISHVEMWDVLCITCQNQDLALEIEKDLTSYQDAGLISKRTELVVVPDPKANIGSGGATFNAVLTIAERLSIRLDYSVINMQAMRNKRILIMHMGRDFQFDVAGRGLFYLPCTFESSTLQVPLPNYLHTFLAITEQIAVGTPPGVWLSSSDIVVHTSLDVYKKFDWSQNYDMVGLAVPAHLEQVAMRHAAYRLNEDDTVANILYQASEDELRKRATGSKHCSNPDDVLALVGIVYLSPVVVETIFSFYEVYPLNACTYMGIDSGAVPIRLSILMDVMQAAATDVSLDQFIRWDANPLAQRARALIYEKLHKCSYKIVTDCDGRFLFPDVDRPSLLYTTLTDFSRFQPLGCMRKSLQAHSFIESKIDPKSTIVINSCIGPSVSLGRGTVIAHTILNVPAIIGEGSIINGLEASPSLNVNPRNVNAFAPNSLSVFDFDGENNEVGLDEVKIIQIPPHIALHQYAVRIPSAQLKQNISVNVVVVFGLKDRLEIPLTDAKDATFCNIPLSRYLERKGIDMTDLWPESCSSQERSLFTAKLYPVLSKAKTLALALWLASPHPDPILLGKWRASWRLSIQEMQTLVDHSASFQHRKSCFSRVACRLVGRDLTTRENSFLAPLYHTSVVFGFSHRVLACLDAIALQSLDERRLARVLSNIAALLAFMSGLRGGIRAGPSRNAAWEAAYEMLLVGEHERAVRAMASLRRDWMDSSQMLMRASRHYEAAFHILIRRACQTAQAFVCLKSIANNENSEALNPQHANAWVVAEAPCRADLAGGWTDTPPMSYEAGGAVLNVAILVNGQRPIGVRIRRLFDTSGIVVCNLDCSTDVTVVRQRWKFDSVEQLDAIDQPYGQATLAKACLYVTGVAQYVKGASEPKVLLTQQLRTAFGSPGIEIHTWANIPDGSGLGTRSIMAGALIAAIWTLSEQQYDMSSVCHAVIQCEQLMATCAGWQDPIGGLVGGVKLAYCQPLLPLHLRWRQIDCSDAAWEQLNQRLVLIYAGNRPPFGASMVVYNVVRNWYSNEPSVLEAARRLTNLAKEAAAVFDSSPVNFDALGPLLTQSHDSKKILAPGSESESFQQIAKLLEPISLGATINGCGDGGFMTVLLRQDFAERFKNSKRDLLNEIQQLIVSSGIQQNFGSEIAVHDANISREGLRVWREQFS